MRDVAVLVDKAAEVDLAFSERGKLDLHGFSGKEKGADRRPSNAARTEECRAGDTLVNQRGIHSVPRTIRPTGSSTSTSDSFSLRTSARPRRWAFSIDS